MKLLNPLTPEENRAYNLRENGTQFTIFEDFQSERVSMTRALIEAVLGGISGPAKIVEPACSAGDISGWFSEEHDVIGVELVPAAATEAMRRYPHMTILWGDVTEMRPIACDILVLCEFLEHLNEPEKFVADWAPLAKWLVVSHPLNDPGGIEPGHLWSYDLNDHYRWFQIGGHTIVRSKRFAMGPFRDMVLSVGGQHGA